MQAAIPLEDHPKTERQITRGMGARILTNTQVWSPDSQWLVYDTRPDASGEVFNGTRIEMVHAQSGEVRVVYESPNNSRCGVATFHPTRWEVVFIHGPENPTPDWSYGPYHRQGVIVRLNESPRVLPLDARDLTSPLTPGALRGGSHVHVWHPLGDWVSFTYEDHLLASYANPGPDHDLNQRNIGVSIPGRPVFVKKDHPRNLDGTHFTVLVTRTHAVPRPGSDEVKKAYEEGWIGREGYVRADGTRQRRALAFLGQVVSERGETVPEVFVADLPDDLSQPGDGPLEGTLQRLPLPPKGVSQRRLTRTTQRKHPGVQGIRHWLRCSPDGANIAFLMKDDAGLDQLWTVSPNGGAPRQLTRNPASVSSTFNWSPDGRLIAHTLDNSLCVTTFPAGKTWRLTPRFNDAEAPRPEACVFSPDGKHLAYVRRVPSPTAASNQIFVLDLNLAAR